MLKILQALTKIITINTSDAIRYSIKPLKIRDFLNLGQVQIKHIESD